ncbi:polysaccharide deacetylase family protein [Pseudonocardia xishanensis]|uniref:NodB homology domain-containing protein n=1 Tax=Pseudonocardia xishanensis TaxID=630995 RepID=A0ABP8RXF8_9PSEU
MTRLTLTFDNGPTPGVTERVLASLAARRLPAVFFVVGQRVLSDGGRRMVEQVAAAGHLIGNHSLTHTDALGDRPDPAYAEREIGETFAVLADLGLPTAMFRPPGNMGKIGSHLLSPGAVDLLLRERSTTIVWNSVPRDWEGPEWVDRLLASVRAQEHTVAVLHDIGGGCAELLDTALDRLLEVPDIEFTREFPDEVVLTRDGQAVSLGPQHVSGPWSSGRPQSPGLRAEGAIT